MARCKQKLPPPFPPFPRGIGDGTVKVDGREIYAAKDLRVGLFTSTEGF
mgnify:CR=1 FL=1